MTTETILETARFFGEQPEKARSRPTVTARTEGSQAILESGPFSWRADLPQPLGGTNAAPSPTAMLLGALAGCAAVFIKDTLAPQLGVRVEEVEATVQADADARGLLGIDGVEPDLQNVRLDVRIASADGEEAVRRLGEVWRERCPVYLALAKPTSVAVEFQAAG